VGLIGKIIGGTIGFAMGGPLGAIAGTAFGHLFDQSKKLDQMPERLSHSQEAQLTFFVGAFSMLAKLARVDGDVSDSELNSVSDFMHYDLNLDAQSQNVAMRAFYAALESPQSFQDFAGQFYQQFYDQPQFLELMLDILLRVAVSDGAMSNTEEQLIGSAARIFGFDDATYQLFKDRYVTKTQHNVSYSVLGCNATDSDDQIKKRYRQLVQDYHPDKIASKGLPEEFTKFAGEKFREIQSAYESIKKERGMR
jgi:DnaJ like chaperone protein